MAKAEQRSPFAPAPLQGLPRHYGLLRPCAPHRYSRPRGWSRLRLLPSRTRRPVLSARTRCSVRSSLRPSSHRLNRAPVLLCPPKVWSRFAPPTCRMSLGQTQEPPVLMPEDGSPPVFNNGKSPLPTSLH